MVVYNEAAGHEALCELAGASEIENVHVSFSIQSVSQPTLGPGNLRIYKINIITFIIVFLLYMYHVHVYVRTFHCVCVCVCVCNHNILAEVKSG